MDICETHSDRKLFCNDWEFYKAAFGSDYSEDFAFKPVDIPHDWLIYNTNDLYETYHIRPECIQFYIFSCPYFPLISLYGHYPYTSCQNNSDIHLKLCPATIFYFQDTILL